MALAVMGAGPALGQSVLHAGLMYNSVRPMDIESPPDGTLEGSKAQFLSLCTLAITDKACVGLWQLKDRPRARQGIIVRNMTDANLQVQLRGCEIHNGKQTIAIDDIVLSRSSSQYGPFYDRSQDGPFDEKLLPGVWMGLDLISPAAVSIFPLKGMRPFQKGVTLTCRTATANPAPP